MSSQKVKKKSQEQTDNRPWLYQKGQSGNPGGRPKGSKSMKTWLKEKFEVMTNAEREAFLEGINKIDLFKMAEGNPRNDVEVSGSLTISQVLDDIAND